MDLVQLCREFIEGVKETEAGRKALLNNTQNQLVGFILPDGDGVTLHLTAKSTETELTSGVPEYRRFHTTNIELDVPLFKSLLEGRIYFSEPYLAGDLTVKGSPTIKTLIGRLFCIHKDEIARKFSLSR